MLKKQVPRHIFQQNNNNTPRDTYLNQEKQCTYQLRFQSYLLQTYSQVSVSAIGGFNQIASPSDSIYKHESTQFGVSTNSSPGTTMYTK